MTPNKLRILVVAVFLAAVLVGYFVLFQTPKIGDIVADPARYDGKALTLRGRADSPDREGFGLSDGTGKIFVLARETVPTEGSQVSVRGVIRKDHQLAGRVETVIEEMR